MRIKTTLSLLSSRHAPAQLLVLQDLKPFIRLHFLYAAIDSGLLRALRRPASSAELIRRLNVRRPELLEPLLELGVSLGELSRDGDLYKLKGRRSRALAVRDGDTLAAVVQEYVTYHGSVYRHLAERLAGAPLGDYLQGTGDMIARSSRIVEPFVGDFVRGVVAGPPVRILEVGCGSGVYLRHAAEANTQAAGVGIDMQPEVVEQASANLLKWGIDRRFKAVHADVREPSAELAGPFDLITLYNNIYYFTQEERPALFRELRSRLAPGGRLALVSLMRGKSFATLDFDLVLRSTAGCTPLPEVGELAAQLRASGFRRIQTAKLMPWEPLYGLVAWPGRWP